MKKYQGTLALVLSFIFFFSVCSTSTFAGTNYVSLTPMQHDTQLNSYLTYQDIYIGPHYDEDSTNGYINIDENGYKGKFRVREIKLVDNDSNLYDSIFLLNLYRGQIKTISKSISDSKTTSISEAISVTASASAGFLGNGGKMEVEATLAREDSWTHSYTVTTTDTFSFPTNLPSNISYVNIYSGFTNDIYEGITEFVPYETYDNKTEVTHISVSSPPPLPGDDDDPHGGGSYSYIVDIFVYLADGRILEESMWIPPHHYEADANNLENIPEVRNYLSQFSDGFYHEYTSGYNFNNKQIVKHIIRVPIPSFKHIGIE